MSAPASHNSQESKFKLFSKLAWVFSGAFLRSWIGISTDRPSNESGKRAKAQDDGSRVGRGFRVAVFLIAIFFIAVFAAFLLFYLMQSSTPPSWAKYIQIGAAGISVSLLIPAINQILLTTENVWKYIKDGKQHSLFAEYVKIGTTFLALSVAVLSMTGADEHVPSSHAAAQAQARQATAPSPREVVYLVKKPDPAASAIEYFPYLYELTDGPDKWSKGVSLSENQIQDLHKLLSSLKACVGTQANQDVEIEIRGYADNNEFPSNTAELNRQAANRRAQDVYRHAKAFIGEQNTASKLILRDAVEWPADDPQAMVRWRYYAGKPLQETGSDRDQGLFNRRADIALLRAGVCERLLSSP